MREEFTRSVVVCVAILSYSSVWVVVCEFCKIRGITPSDNIRGTLRITTDVVVVACGGTDAMVFDGEDFAAVCREEYRTGAIGMRSTICTVELVEVEDWCAGARGLVDASARVVVGIGGGAPVPAFHEPIIRPRASYQKRSDPN